MAWEFIKEKKEVRKQENMHSSEKKTCSKKLTVTKKVSTKKRTCCKSLENPVATGALLLQNTETVLVSCMENNTD